MMDVSLYDFGWLIRMLIRYVMGFLILVKDLVIFVVMLIGFIVVGVGKIISMDKFIFVLVLVYIGIFEFN